MLAGASVPSVLTVTNRPFPARIAIRSGGAGEETREGAAKASARLSCGPPQITDAVRDASASRREARMIAFRSSRGSLLADWSSKCTKFAATAAAYAEASSAHLSADSSWVGVMTEHTACAACSRADELSGSMRDFDSSASSRCCSGLYAVVASAPVTATAPRPAVGAAVPRCDPTGGSCSWCRRRSSAAWSRPCLSHRGSRRGRREVRRRH